MSSVTVTRMSAVFLLSFVVVSSWADDKKAEPPPKKETDTKFENHKALAGEVKKAGKVILYEGLPHQMFDKKLLEEELKAKKTVKFNDFPFYEETLKLKDEDSKKLTELFCEPKSFKKWSGEKRCGGFHPDYCIEWQVDKEVYRVHVCFGCQEIKAFGPKTELRCDIAKDALESFGKILKPYQKNRPKAK